MNHARRLKARLLTTLAAAGISAAACSGSVKDGDEKSGGQRGEGGDASAGAAPASCEYGNAEEACYSRESLENMVRFGGGQIPIEPTPTDAEVAAAFLPNGCLPVEKTFDGCCNAAVSGPVRKGDTCCYVHCTGACCGRPLLVDGAARVAAPEARADWMFHDGDEAASERASGGSAVGGAVARAWLEDGLLEHASIASFSRFTLDLLAHGAPPELVHGAHRAGMDEIEHARLCFALAARFGGAKLGPGALPLTGVVAGGTLEDAVDRAVREGCVGETVAAVVAREALDRAVDAAVRAALSRIAEDEANHAALALRFVAWALGRDPSLRGVVRAAFAEECARSTLSGPTLGASARAEWHAAGRLEGAELTGIERDTKQIAVAAAAEALLSAPRAAAVSGLAAMRVV